MHIFYDGWICQIDVLAEFGSYLSLKLFGSANTTCQEGTCMPMPYWTSFVWEKKKTGASAERSSRDNKSQTVILRLHSYRRAALCRQHIQWCSFQTSFLRGAQCSEQETVQKKRKKKKESIFAKGSLLVSAAVAHITATVIKCGANSKPLFLLWRKSKDPLQTQCSGHTSSLRSCYVTAAVLCSHSSAPAGYVQKILQKQNVMEVTIMQHNVG